VIAFLMLIVLGGLFVYWAHQFYKLARFGAVAPELMRRDRGDDLFAAAGMVVLGFVAGFYYRWWLGVVFAFVCLLQVTCAALRTYYLHRTVPL
jgi:hypothetical protein